MRELAHRWPRFGYRRLIVLLHREGIEVNHKKAYRIYTEEDLKVRRKRKKIRSRVRTAPLSVPSKPNERWSMDFMQDCLADGRRFRVLTIVDDFTRECPAVEVDTSIPGARVVRVLERLAFTRGLPKVIVSDNGSEFTGKVLDAWSNRRGIKLHFIDPGRPGDRPSPSIQFGETDATLLAADHLVLKGLSGGSPPSPATCTLDVTSRERPARLAGRLASVLDRRSAVSGAALLVGLVAGIRLIRHQVRRTSAPWLLGLALLLQLVALLL